jgi:hypothetical protein
MVRPTEVKALEGYRLWLRYSDGVEGEVDLSRLVGRGVFKAWEDKAFFEAVRIDEAGAVSWGEEIDLCPDALYLKLTGKPPEEAFQGLKPVRSDA